MAAGVKAYRHRRIARILRAQTVTSQTELVSLLERAGEQVTQATLSRDLEELGAFKARLRDGRLAYRLPDEPPANGNAVSRMLAEFVSEIEWSANLVVLRTPPGCAQPVARAIDTAPPKDVLATVAGDDTVLVVCRDGVPGRKVAKQLESMASETAASKGA